MALPAQLRAIQHHLRTAQEHEKRDPVVTYYCRLYAMQTGMKLDSKTPECRKFLVKLMDQLETMKKELNENDSITQEVVGNAHIENYALKLFLYADNEDRAERFHKNMIKSFYTSSLLMDVLSVFGELSDENIQHRKYARWKATYIHNCLKNGETPQSGPIGMDEDEEAVSNLTQPSPTGPPASNYNNIQIPPGAHAPANTPAELPPPSGGVQLSPEDFTKAQKYCKYAGSALQYEDVSTAIQNLQKALKLLTTGKE
uniref:Vacuolar protein sorting-associated protein VTA1 homolog n=1 Tax=Xiphophorus maculatus TaxID=8083 RepID=M4A3J8_XIPMA